MTYQPTPKVAEIMTWCLEKVKSVPYRVTLRWLFYQAYQESRDHRRHWGLHTKQGYSAFKSWASRVRKNFWNGWTPETLVDDTRELEMHGGGHATPESWIESFRNETCMIDKRQYQKQIVLLCFEADAMRRQFEHYTKDYHVSLAPFRGDASIDYKWKIAKWIEELKKAYGKPVKVLYFGDLDPKGAEIPENAMRDIRAWCKFEFAYEIVGLKQEHVARWNLPENPDKHGYQWEALSDNAARELIQTALNANVDLDAIKKAEDIEHRATVKWQEIIGNLLDEGV